MLATTMASASPSAMPCKAANCLRYCASRSAIVAPEKAPASTPTSVIPTCTVGRKVAGWSASSTATAAPLAPRRAMAFSRALRAETTASSDIAKKPLSRISARTMKISR
jgi:hypothetical protein